MPLLLLQRKNAVFMKAVRFGLLSLLRENSPDAEKEQMGR